MFSSRKKKRFRKYPKRPSRPPTCLMTYFPGYRPCLRSSKNSPRGPLGVRAECHRFFMQEIVSRNVKFRHPNKCRFQYRVQKNLVVSFCSACCNGLAESIHAVVVVLVLRGLHFFRKRAITFVLNSIEDKVCIKQVTIFGVRNYYGL